MLHGRPPRPAPDGGPAVTEKFLPQRVPIEQFGAGGFRFGGMSHQGALMVLPSGMRAWPVTGLAQLVSSDLEALAKEREQIDFVVIGTGQAMQRLPQPIVAWFREKGLGFEVMATSPAVHVYNVVVAEGRRVAALLMPTGDQNG